MKIKFYKIFLLSLLVFAACRGEETPIEIKIEKIFEKGLTQKYIPNFSQGLEDISKEGQWIIEKKDLFDEILYEDDMLILTSKNIEGKTSITYLRKTYTGKKIQGTVVVELKGEGGSWIVDPNLRKAIREKLNKEKDEEISFTEVENMEGLSAKKIEIITLEGLEMLKSIKGNWELNENNISNIEPIEKLKIYGYLDLSNNPLFPIEGTKLINGLEEVVEIVNKKFLASDNYEIIKRIEGKVEIKESIKLEKENNIDVVIPIDLNLRNYIKKEIGEEKLIKGEKDSYVKLKDLNHEDVATLFLSSIGVNSLNGFQKIKRIGYWDFSFNSLKNLEGLNSLVEAEGLVFANNELISILSLSKLTRIKELDLSKNKLTTVKGISNLTSASRINFSENKLTNIKELTKLISLDYLDLSRNELVDINGLSNFKSIGELNLSNNPLIDISPLSNLISIDSLDLSNTKIDKIDKISHLASIDILNLSYTSIENIDVLSNLTSLDILNLKNTNIKDLKGLLNFSSIGELNIVGTPLKNLDDLINIKSIEKLYTGKNPFLDNSEINKLQKRIDEGDLKIGTWTKE